MRVYVKDWLELQGGLDYKDGLEVVFQGWENVKDEGGETCARYARMGIYIVGDSYTYFTKKILTHFSMV